MAKENIKISYDKEEDIISLFKEESKSKFSFELELPKGNIIIDYDFNGYIVGLEFFNASKYFPFLNELEDIDNLRASMSVQYGINWAQISYIFYIPNSRQNFVSFINAPYNKKIILEH